MQVQTFTVQTFTVQGVKTKSSHVVNTQTHSQDYERQRTNKTKPDI